jgi:hypothetical protein
MRVVFADNITSSEETMKRLLLVADEIGFMDRPGYVFPGDWGFVGVRSPHRNVDWSGQPVTVTVHAPPREPVLQLYASYIEADLNNPEFSGTFLAGLADDAFAAIFLQAHAPYRPGVTGATVRTALLADPTLREVAPGPGAHDLETAYLVDTPEHRKGTLRDLLADASARVSIATVVGATTGLAPISESPHFARLIGIRTAALPVSPNPVSTSAPQLGLAIARAVIPDEALQKLNILDVLRYRAETQDAYKAWSTDVERLATRIADIPGDRRQVEIHKLLASEIQPKVREYQNEMASVRDKLFGDLVKQVLVWEVPALILAHAFQGSLGGAIAAFATTRMIPGVVDFLTKRGDIERRNPLAYLIGVRPMPAAAPVVGMP